MSDYLKALNGLKSFTEMMQWGPLMKALQVLENADGELKKIQVRLDAEEAKVVAAKARAEHAMREAEEAERGKADRILQVEHDVTRACADHYAALSKAQSECASMEARVKTSKDSYDQMIQARKAQVAALDTQIRAQQHELSAVQSSYNELRAQLLRK